MVAVVKRVVVGAHYGLRDWLAQRVSAALLALYTLLLAVVLGTLPGLDYWHWKALWQLPVMRYMTVVVLLGLYYHAWVGVRDIIMDYVKDAGLRLVLYVIVIAALVGYTAWTVEILWAS